VIGELQQIRARQEYVAYFNPARPHQGNAKYPGAKVAAAASLIAYASSPCALRFCLPPLFGPPVRHHLRIHCLPDLRERLHEPRWHIPLLASRTIGSAAALFPPVSPGPPAGRLSHPNTSRIQFIALAGCPPPRLWDVAGAGAKLCLRPAPPARDQARLTARTRPRRRQWLAVESTLSAWAPLCSLGLP